MRTRSWFPYLAFGLCSVLYLWPFMTVLFPTSDQGTLLYGALRVARGQVPSRDFFEVMGPGSFYWLAAFFKLLGANLLAARISLALTSFCIALLMYFLTRRLKTGYSLMPAISLLAALSAYFLPQISHHTDSTLFALLSFAALVCWIETNRPLLLCLAGALTGLTTLFLQPKGIFLFISFVPLVVLLRGKARLVSCLSWLTGGYLAVLLTALLLYWRAGALPDLIYANVFWPLENYSGLNVVPYGLGLGEYWTELKASFGSVTSPVIAGVVASLLTVPQAVIVALPAILIAFALLYRRRAFDRVTLPYWAAGTALWLSELHRKGMANLMYGSPLLIILLFYFLARERRPVVRGALQFICVTTLTLAAFNLLLAHYASAKVVTPRGSLYAFRPDPVLDFLDTHVEPGQDIFVYPYRPIYYFLSGAENPTRFSILLYHLHTDAQFSEAVRSLQLKEVKYVIWERKPMVLDGFPAYSAPPSDQLIMEPYLASRYRLLKSIEGVDILERLDGRPTPYPNPVPAELVGAHGFKLLKGNAIPSRKEIYRDTAAVSAPGGARP